ncbi:glycosyltransferase [Tepidibacillus sp. LV47]|uniref:glycosyltransferase n=1 Tax=Tepidibacillus sp. LV47 TaxID=3398228 RepID=UPI003AADC653
MPRYTIIYPPTVSWHEPIFQRPHQLLKEFARQGHFSIFANKVTDGHGDYWFASENLCISNDLKATLDHPMIKEKVKETKVVLWVTLPETIDLKDLVHPDIIVFDYIDESTEEFSAWKYKLDESMELADIIFVASKKLYDLTHAQYPQKTYLLPNAADIRKYFQKKYILPKDLRPLKRKYKLIVGFIGSLQSWVDYKLIKEMAILRPKWGFVLIGPEYFPATILKRIPNVHFLGPKRYRILHHYVKNFDVGIIPFQVREMTNSSSPIKMYEYLAAGIPVVATPIKECKRLSPIVRIARTGKGSVKKIEEAIYYSKKEKHLYLQIAKNNSWEKRVQEIILKFNGMRQKLVVGMLVKNEANRYLKRVIENISSYADELVVLDDKSIDDTVDVIRKTSTIPTYITSIDNGNFYENEIELRKRLYQLVLSRNPDWFMIVDADEIFDQASREKFEKLMNQNEVDVWGFKLYDMWDETHYRSDEYWRAHEYSTLMLVRNIRGFQPEWRETPIHCGRLPSNLWSLRTKSTELMKIKHYGWADPEDRKKKYERYMKYDPKGEYRGNIEQYLSILDEKPNLVSWDDGK